MYKVGDRVRYIEGSIEAIPKLIGHIGTVIKVYENEGKVDGVRVRFDTGDTGTGDIGWGCSLVNLEPWTDEPGRFDTWPVKVLLEILKNNPMHESGHLTKCEYFVDVVEEMRRLRIRTTDRILFWVSIDTCQVILAHNYAYQDDRDIVVATTTGPNSMVTLGTCIARFCDSKRPISDWYHHADTFYKNGA